MSTPKLPTAHRVVDCSFATATSLCIPLYHAETQLDAATIMMPTAVTKHRHSPLVTRRRCQMQTQRHLTQLFVSRTLATRLLKETLASTTKLLWRLCLFWSDSSLKCTQVVKSMFGLIISNHLSQIMILEVIVRRIKILFYNSSLVIIYLLTKG